MDTDTSWCPVCDRQILPKRFLVPVPPPPSPPPPPPPSSPIRRTKGGTIRQRSGGLVQGTGRVKPNGSIKRSDSTKNQSPPPSAPPTKLRTVIDQGPTPLYCSDECQLADIHDIHGGLPINYHPDRLAISPSAVSFSRSDSGSDSTDSSVNSLPSYSSRPSQMSPSLATLAAIYNFPPLPPPPPIDEPTSSSDSDCQPPEYSSGVMMAARRIAEYCPKPQRRDQNGHIVPSEPPKAIPGWNDGSNGWRSSIYSFSSPQTQSGHDVKAYRSFAATSHRSRGVQSTFNASSSSRSATDVRSATSLPVEPNEMIHKFSQSFNRRSESRVSLYSSPPQSQSPLSSISPQKRERSLLQPGAEGKLLVPDVKMKVHSGSSTSLSSAWSGLSSRRSSVRSPLSVMSNSSDEDGLTQRCESAISLPQMTRPIVEGEPLFVAFPIIY